MPARATTATALLSIIIIATFGLGAPASARADEDEIRLARHPAVTPDGSHVIFSYAGDLWRVRVEGGVARRLTAHPAEDRYPVVSPDGRWLAFSSARDGAQGADVHVLPLAGGPVRRLTWDGATDRPLSFSRDGSLVYFLSTRRALYRKRALIYSQRVEGPREPETVLEDEAVWYQPVPQSETALVVRGGAPWWRKGCRGAGSSDVWSVEGGARWTQLTTNRGRDHWPIPAPDGKSFFFVSERDGTDNLFSRPIAGVETEPRQLTRFADDGVRYPSVSADGTTAVFERGFDLWSLRLDAAGAEPKRIPIRIYDDAGDDPIARRRVRAASEVAPSPDGSAIAFVARGELYVRRADDGEPVRLTETPAREEGIAWAPDGKSLTFVSDREGTGDIFRVRAADGEDERLHRALRFTTELVLGGPAEENRPGLSPDGKTLAFVRGLGELWALDLAEPGATPRRLLEGWDAPSYEWSPDSRWLAFSREDDDFNADVWLLELGTGRVVNVSQHPDHDGSPAWSPDGKKLAFVSQRRGNDPEIYYVYLRRADDEKTRQDWADEKEDEKKKKAATPKKAAPEKPKGPDGDDAAKGAGEKTEAGDDDEKADDDEKKKAAEPKVTVEVDADEIWQRIRPVKALLGDQNWVAWTADSEQLLFRSNHQEAVDIYRVKPDGSDLERVTSGQSPAGIALHRKSKSIYFLRGGASPRAGSVPAKVGEAGGKVTTWGFDERIELPRTDERRQVFAEAWRTMKNRWYDGTFKGKDWDAIGASYRPLAESRKSHSEFQDVVSLMLGELNGSHLGISGGDDAGRDDATEPLTGMLGAELAPGESGWVVTEVLPDGPCDQERARLAPGDRVLAVDGATLAGDDVLVRHLVGTVGRKVTLTVARKDATGEPERIVVRPVSSREIRDLDYERWTDATRALIEARSKGRLGYVHIRGMNEQSLDRFEAELYARAHGRDALVIDVRDNGGGWTADYLLAILAAPEHAFTIPRGGGRGYPQGRRPLAAWSKPVAVLCNERSFSNAEIFSHAVKTTGRGVLVGRETFGGVISTGATTLLDGSTLRLPFRGWFVLGTGADMDKQGAVPDIAVDNLPGESDRDRQAEAAVDELIRRLAQ